VVLLYRAHAADRISMDVTDGESPTGKYSNSARRACYALMSKAGETGTGFNETTAMMYCSAFAALKDRSDHASPQSA
jgi:hypothetical protein